MSFVSAVDDEAVQFRLVLDVERRTPLGSPDAQFPINPRLWIETMNPKRSQPRAPCQEHLTAVVSAHFGNLRLQCEE